MRGEINILKKEQQEQIYKIEDQENRERRKNLRIRGLPEPTQAENLIEIMNKIFNPILGKEESNIIKIERVHKIRRPQGLSMEKPRDIIVRFKNWEEKNQIWIILKRKPLIEKAEVNLRRTKRERP